MKILKVSLKSILLIFILLLSCVAVYSLWERNRDPLAAINFPADSVRAKVTRLAAAEFSEQDRTYRHIILTSGNLGSVEAYLSLPADSANRPLPVILILGGLEIGLKNFRMIDHPGRNAIVIYRYPYSPHYWYDGTAISQLPVIRSAVLRVPAQVVTLAGWLGEQVWADKNRVTILGYSFGALFIPAVYRLAGEWHVPLRPGVMAYGGAGLFDLFKTNLKKVNQPWKSALSWLAATAIYPAEPALHLPHLQNEFLIINGNQDHQIPKSSWTKLHQLTPQPKTIILLDEGHMHPRKPELTKKLVDISRGWLLDRGVINP